MAATAQAPAELDARQLKDNFALVAAHGDEVASYFYAHLFCCHPQLRELFPVSLADQRGRLLAALGRVVSQVDDLERLLPFLSRLGREHRRFGAVAGHYPAVGASLLATLEHFSGEHWNPGLAAAWHAAYGLVARVMVEAAEQAGDTPAAWEANVIAHERRTRDIAVLTLYPDAPLRYRPGQSVPVEAPYEPLQWRPYSPANRPRADGTIELHVRWVPGGPVSTALVCRTEPGQLLRLGAPVGRLTLDQAIGSDLVLVAGGTGLAPLRAIVEQVAAQLAGGGRTAGATAGDGPAGAAPAGGGPAAAGLAGAEPAADGPAAGGLAGAEPAGGGPAGGVRSDWRVHLLVGARTERDLYDLPALIRLAEQHDWLRVTPVVSEEGDYAGERGLVGDVAARRYTGSRIAGRYGAGRAPGRDRAGWDRTGWDRAGWDRTGWEGAGRDGGEQDFFVCGSSLMVAGTRARLRAAGVPGYRIHDESFGRDPGYDDLSTTAAGRAGFLQRSHG